MTTVGSPGAAGLSPPALSSTPLSSTLRWVGPGRTAFAGAAGKDRRGESSTAASAEETLGRFGDGGDPSFLTALRDYFDGGGGPCTVLNLASPESLAADRRAALWVGEDGGAGLRAGVWSLCDDEDVGTIAAPGLRDLSVRRALVALARVREDRFVVLDSLPDGETEELPPADRAAVVRGWRRDEEGIAVPPCGAAMAGFERSDFREDRPQDALRALLGTGFLDAGHLGSGHPTLHSAPDAAGRFASVEAWRAWEGLRRSLDRGTRWVVFEVAGEFLRRRIERELAAFLARLHRLGLLRGRTPEEAFLVRTSWGESGPGGPVESSLVLDVEVRMAGGSRRGVEIDLASIGGPPIESASHRRG